MITYLYKKKRFSWSLHKCKKCLEWLNIEYTMNRLQQSVYLGRILFLRTSIAFMSQGATWYISSSVVGRTLSPIFPWRAPWTQVFQNQRLQRHWPRKICWIWKSFDWRLFPYSTSRNSEWVKVIGWSVFQVERHQFILLNPILWKFNFWLCKENKQRQWHFHSPKHFIQINMGKIAASPWLIWALIKDFAL
jgi:hypothetical protein